MFQGVKVFDLPPVLWLPLPAVAPPTLVPKRRSEVRGAQGRGCSPQPPLRSENPQDGTPCTTPFPPCAPNPCPQTPHGSTWRPGEVGFSAAHLRSESKKRGTSARSAPVPRVFAAFGTRTSGRRRSLPPIPARPMLPLPHQPLKLLYQLPKIPQRRIHRCRRRHVHARPAQKLDGGLGAAA